MAGAGVGGVGMLRARRRDVSVKPNRKLDRKSSRGMIYENEELRLRTIHINAEVEQGQNDIKKLRRENEQLRREIWSLRDEYDKLEEILKRQKNPTESDESEDRSEEDDDVVHSDYSEENEQEDEEPEKIQNGNERTTQEHDQEEQLENAENQKISTEKMNNNSLHRLHVDFDDLSVVDEEEELKKEKDRKETTIMSEENQEKFKVRLIEPRKLHDNIPFYPGSYDSSQSYTDPNYFQEYPCPTSTVDSLIRGGSNLSNVLPSLCPAIYAEPLIPLGTLDSPILNPINDKIIPEIHVPPIGWQNNLLLSESTALPSYPNVLASSSVSNSTMRMANVESSQQQQHLESHAVGNYQSFANTAGIRQKRNLDDSKQQQQKQGNQLALKLFENSHAYIPRQQKEVSLGNLWDDIDASCEKNIENERINGHRNIENNEEKDSDEIYAFDDTEKPKHFFAPLATTKSKKLLDEESPTVCGSNYFGTGTSSSSGKTGSTVICESNQLLGLKGSIDVCVNGAVSYGNNFYREKEDTQRNVYLSTDNLLIESVKPIPINQLTKSMSCQDLSSDSQPLTKINYNEKGQTMTMSDNTLDNLTNESSSTKAYRSHLNVTLKIPRHDRERNANTPEIPQLPSMDYRILTNPFLRNIERNVFESSDKNSPITKPLSVQVSENNINYSYPSSPPPPQQPLGFTRGLRPSERYRRRQGGNLLPDQNRLLIPTDQLIPNKNLSTPTQDFQVTSFERPSPHALLPSAMPYDLDTLRRINATRYLQNQNLYQNIPFVPAHVCPTLQMYYDQNTKKVPAQTQTSIDGDSHIEDDQSCLHHPEEENNISIPNSPSGQRRKRTMKKDKLLGTKALSPLAQRKLKKQNSVTSTEMPESPGKSVVRQRARKLSITTTTTSDALEDKNESRSSSSGQDSPRKDQVRRMSTYFNPKQRPSLTSIKTTRSGSLETSKDKYSDGLTTTTSDKEIIHSAQIREGSNVPVKSRKGSTSSGNVPWCACWGNGCV
ncbi:PREDICTED: uncharacterized protein LOC106786824 isoform X1 [Polistes canadensis]|uniref:uncharacterized protein LOC106786824 isoform X1 n=2 Tax=Polistes canadensis TaxID=91411 RepID=UPI000718F880|nr:PREDICTED: uncharacterized protein LOC106786824 isoform X1 [Polistes canadensis]